MVKMQFSPSEIGKLTPIADNVIVTDMNFGERVLNSGIILKSDDGKDHGIKPRWCRVWAIGNEQKDVKVGEWICVEHGRWTRGHTVEDESGKEIVIRRIDANGIMVSADEPPSDVYIPK